MTACYKRGNEYFLSIKCGDILHQPRNYLKMTLFHINYYLTDPLFSYLFGHIFTLFSIAKDVECVGYAILFGTGLFLLLCKTKPCSVY